MKSKIDNSNMRNIVYAFILSICSINYSFSQEKLVFNLGISKIGLDYIVSRGTNENRDFDAIVDFLKEEFDAEVTFTDEQRNSLFSSLSSVCKVINVGWEIGSFRRDLGAVGRYPMKVVFSFCDDQNLSYDFNVNINGYTYDLKMAILRGLRKNIPINDIYEKLYKSAIINNSKIITQDTINKYLDDSTKNFRLISGYYKLVNTSNFTSLEKIAICDIDNKLSIINIENSAFKKDWKIGQEIGWLQSTSSNKYFVGKYKGLGNNEDDISITYEDNLLEMTFTKNKQTRKFIKIK